MIKNLDFYLRHPSDLPGPVRDAISSLSDTASSKSFVKLNLNELMEKHLQLPFDANDTELEYARLRQLLRHYRLQVVPNGSPCDMTPQSRVYIINQIVLENDENISMLRDLQQKEKLNRVDMSHISRAREKLSNFNIMLRVFEGLFVVTPYLDTNQRSYLLNLIYDRPLPHDGTRLVQALFNYCSEVGNPRYDYSKKNLCLSPLDEPQTEVIIEDLAQVAAHSNAICFLDDSYPYFEKLKKRYYALKPLAVGSILRSSRPKGPVQVDLVDLLSFINQMKNVNLNYENTHLRSYCRNLGEEFKGPCARLGDRFARGLHKHYKGSRDVLQQCLKEFFDEDGQYFLPDPETFEFDTEFRKSRVEARSTSLITCFTYPFVIYKDLNENEQLSALAHRFRSMHGETCGTGSALFFYFIVLSALDGEHLEKASKVLAKHAASGTWEMAECAVLFWYFFRLDKKARDEPPDFIKERIIANTHLRYALFARLLMQCKKVSSIPEQYRFITYSCLYEIFNLRQYAGLGCSPEGFVTGIAVDKLRPDFKEIDRLAGKKSSLLGFTPEVIQHKYKFTQPFTQPLFASQPVFRFFAQLLMGELQTCEYLQIDYTMADDYFRHKYGLSGEGEGMQNFLTASMPSGARHARQEQASAPAAKPNEQLIMVALNSLKHNCVSPQVLEMGFLYGRMFYDIDYPRVSYDTTVLVTHPSMQLLRQNGICFAPLFKSYGSENLRETPRTGFVRDSSAAYDYVKCFRYDPEGIALAGKKLLTVLKAMQFSVELFYMIEGSGQASGFDRTVQKIISELEFRSVEERKFAYDYARAFCQVLEHVSKAPAFRAASKLSNLYLKFSRHGSDTPYLQQAYAIFKGTADFCISNNRFNPRVVSIIQRVFSKLSLEQIDLGRMFIAPQRRVNDASRLDQEVIRKKIRESMEVSDVIGQIRDEGSLGEGEDLLRGLPGGKEEQPAHVPQSSLELDPDVLALIGQISGSDFDEGLEGPSFEAMCRDCNFMSMSSAIEIINDICFENFDEALFDFDDADNLVYIDRDVLKKLST